MEVQNLHVEEKLFLHGLKENSKVLILVWGEMQRSVLKNVQFTS